MNLHVILVQSPAKLCVVPDVCAAEVCTMFLFQFIIIYDRKHIKSWIKDHMRSPIASRSIFKPRVSKSPREMSEKTPIPTQTNQIKTFRVEETAFTSFFYFNLVNDTGHTQVEAPCKIWPYSPRLLPSSVWCWPSWLFPCIYGHTVDTKRHLRFVGDFFLSPFLNGIINTVFLP